MYGGSSTYLPLKINMSGVIPPIFASSILAIPTLIAQFGKSGQSWVDWINKNLANTTSVWYIALYALMIVFFCFFYTSITFNPDETADNMKEYGGFIPGIRAGNATSRYLNYVMNRLNTVGAVYLLFVALIPTVLIMALNLNSKLPFGGTTILIIAGVGLDTLRQAKGRDRAVPVHRLPCSKASTTRKADPSALPPAGANIYNVFTSPRRPHATADHGRKVLARAHRPPCSPSTTASPPSRPATSSATTSRTRPSSALRR